MANANVATALGENEEPTTRRTQPSDSLPETSFRQDKFDALAKVVIEIAAHCKAAKAAGSTQRAEKATFTEKVGAKLEAIKSFRAMFPVPGSTTKRVCEGTPMDWSHFCERYFGVSKQWVNKLIAKYDAANGSKPVIEKKKPSTKAQLDKALDRIKTLEAARSSAAALSWVDPLDATRRYLGRYKDPGQITAWLEDLLSRLFPQADEEALNRGLEAIHKALAAPKPNGAAVLAEARRREEAKATTPKRNRLDEGTEAVAAVYGYVTRNGKPVNEPAVAQAVAV
jgi:hypothetical protein